MHIEDRVKRLLGTSEAIRLLEQEIDRASRSDAKVLITGESGAGKEIVAHLIHARSHRRSAPMLTINCAGLADSLLESELFGHVRGSFTGAIRDKAGLLELADHGTLFMDELAEMTVRMQALLLRFLETGEVQRVGSERPQRRVNVRIIGATNRNLRDQIAEQKFREDLYFRLNVINLAVPPLRERREDLPVLVNHFLALYSAERGVPTPHVAPDTMERLLAYRWPGNVRELRNVIERAVLRIQGDTLVIADLPPEFAPVAAEPLSPAPSNGQPPWPPLPPEETNPLFERMVSGGESFWTVVYEPFMRRDLTRSDLREIIGLGLQEARGNYRSLVQLFNMPATDYKRFWNLLRKYGCLLPFQDFRTVPTRAAREPRGTRTGTPPPTGPV
jgi:DNA-binding NtrC family response regulator